MWNILIYLFYKYALLIKSSKYLISKSFSLSVVWNIWWISPLRVTLMLTVLFQNQIEWIISEFFSWRHLKASCWFFIAHTFAHKRLTENFNWESSNDVCWRNLLFIWIERCNFLSLNFKIILFLYFSRWHACKSSEVTSCTVREIALQAVSSKTLSPMS